MMTQTPRASPWKGFQSSDKRCLEAMFLSALPTMSHQLSPHLKRFVQEQRLGHDDFKPNVRAAPARPVIRSSEHSARTIKSRLEECEGVVISWEKARTRLPHRIHDDLSQAQAAIRRAPKPIEAHISDSEVTAAARILSKLEAQLRTVSGSSSAHRAHRSLTKITFLDRFSSLICVSGLAESRFSFLEC